MKSQRLSTKIIYTVLLIAFTVGFLFTTYKIVHILDNKHRNENIVNEIQEISEKDVLVTNVSKSDESVIEENDEIYTYDFQELREKNSDTIAWIEIPEVEISFPVVQTTDNLYYLSHSFDKSKNINGWVFMNYLNNKNFKDQNTTIFAHNSLFKAFKTMYNSHSKNKFSIYIYKEDEVLVYDVFSLYLTVSYDVDVMEQNFSNIMIKDLINKSVYDYQVEVNENDRILTLSTCYNDSTKRVIVHAKRV